MGRNRRADRQFLYLVLGHGRLQGDGVIRGVEMVEAHAAIEDPLVAELDGVEHIQALRVDFAFREGAAAHGIVTSDGVARIRMVQIGIRQGTQAGRHIAVVGLLFAGELGACHDGVLEYARIELCADHGLVGQNRVFLILHGAQRARHGPGRRIGRDRRLQVGHAAHEGRQQVILLGLAVARGVLDLYVGREIMVDAQGAHVGLDLVVICGGTVEILRVDPGGAVQEGTEDRLLFRGNVRRRVARQADGRHAAVGHVVLVHVQVAGRDARRFADTERDGGREGPALVGDFIARRVAAVLRHQVQAHGRARIAVEDAVPVGRGAFLLAAARRQQGIELVFHGGRLADQIDRTGGRTAAAVRARRALQYVDLFDVEDVARNGAHVAHAVDIDAAGRIETAHVDGVARVRVAVFAEEEGADAWRVAQCVRQGQRALLFDQFLLDHDDGLRRIDQLFRVFRRRGFFGLEIIFLGAHDLDFVQGLLRCRGTLAGRVGRLGGDGQQHHGQGGADVLVETGWGVFAALDCHLALSISSGWWFLAGSAPLCLGTRASGWRWRRNRRYCNNWALFRK